MDVTVCICTHDRPAYVRACLDGLARQTLPRSRFEILLVDSASNPSAADRLAALAAAHDVRLIRVDRPGVSLARNTGAMHAQAGLIAYIDDDAIPAPDWLEALLLARRETGAALIGGRILPIWEAPLPDWWPTSLVGILSIITTEGQGVYRTSQLPAGLEPYAANMAVDVAALRSVGGFGGELGRYGTVLLSDEEVRLAWALQDAGHVIIHDGRPVVHHQIQASRLNPAWLLRRLYWQGASTVTTRRQTNASMAVWLELPRRLLVLLLFGVTALIPRHAPQLIGLRWRVAYAAGFARAALGWHPGRSAERTARRMAANGATQVPPTQMAPTHMAPTQAAQPQAAQSQAVGA